MKNAKDLLKQHLDELSRFIDHEDFNSICLEKEDQEYNCVDPALNCKGKNSLAVLVLSVTYRSLASKGWSIRKQMYVDKMAVYCLNNCKFIYVYYEIRLLRISNMLK